MAGRTGAQMQGTLAGLNSASMCVCVMCGDRTTDLLEASGGLSGLKWEGSWSEEAETSQVSSAPVGMVKLDPGKTLG